MTKAQLSVAEMGALGYASGAIKPEGKGKNASMFTIFPLLTLALIAYTGLSFTSGPDWTVYEVARVTMVSDQVWSIRGGDIFLTFSLGLLWWEIVRATDSGTGSVVNHVISAGLFIVCLLLFILAPNYGTSAFFLMMMMALVDFMAGIVVTITAARRDFGVGG